MKALLRLLSYSGKSFRQERTAPHRGSRDISRTGRIARAPFLRLRQHNNMHTPDRQSTHSIIRFCFPRRFLFTVPVCLWYDWITEAESR